MPLAKRRVSWPAESHRVGRLHSLLRPAIERAHDGGAALSGKSTVTNLICTAGRQQEDWSAHYRLYPQERVEESVLFDAAREELLTGARSSRARSARPTNVLRDMRPRTGLAEAGYSVEAGYSMKAGSRRLRRRSRLCEPRLIAGPAAASRSDWSSPFRLPSS